MCFINVSKFVVSFQACSLRFCLVYLLILNFFTILYCVGFKSVGLNVHECWHTTIRSNHLGSNGGEVTRPSQQQGNLDNLGEPSMTYLPFYMIVKFLLYVMTTLCTQHPLVSSLPLTIAIKLPQICLFMTYQIV